MKLLQTINTLLSTIVILIILSLLGGGIYLGYSLYEASRSAQQAMEQALAEKESELAKVSAELKVREEDIKRKETQITQLSNDLATARVELERKEREIQRLTMALQLLKVDRRVAYLDVLSQAQSEDGQAVKTTVRFVEVDEHGRPVEKPRTFDVMGDKVYVDALVVKFADKYVEEGDPLRAASLCLFQRVFGNAQSPDNGVRIDREGDQPAVYKTGQLRSDFERELWAQFWDFARDEEKARQAGVRAAHGEAVYVLAQPGTRYRLTLRASDGLSITPAGPIPDHIGSETL
ncbi:MAG: hypothetical protein ACUVQG_12705 [Thermogutta sp.]